MKRSGFAVLGAAAILMLNGCVYANNGGGKKLSEEEKEEIDMAIDEAKSTADSILDSVKEELDDKMEDVDWAREMFQDYSGNNGKPLKIIKTGARNEYHEAKENGGTLIQIDNTEEFIKGMNVDEWNKEDALPEGLEKEYVYIVEQPATETILQDNSGKYFEIARITTYKDSNYIMVNVLTDEQIEELIIPESRFVSVYSVSDETADYFRK